MRPDPQEILAGLNERQREAVAAIGGPVLVIAGPGSGKTKALTHRVAYLMATGIPGRKLLAVTFTNKAAEEMRHRVANLLLGDDQRGEGGKAAFGLGEAAPQQFYRAQRFTKRSDSPISPSAMPFIGTFHSFAASLLRREAGRIGYRPDFSIYDEDDRMALLKEVMKELAVPKHISAVAASAVISDLKADLVAWDEYEGRGSGDPFGRAIGRIYEAYQERLRLSGALDFDDLLFYAVRILREHPPVFQRWRSAFSHLHVDEYQDTSPAQYELVRLLAAEHKNLFAIGDDAQSIYGWRRADYRNILNFERDWPEAKVILLEENYRSTPEILAAANHLIAKNIDQKPKALWTANSPGERPVISAHADGRDEAEFIAEEISSLHQSGHAWHDLAVLYRTNAQSRALEEALIERAVPYTIVGGIRFYQRREIKDLIAYLRYLANPDDALSLKRIVNVPPRGIGPKTFLAYLSGQAGSLSARDRARTANFEAVAANLRLALAENTLAGFLRTLIKTIRYDAYLADERDGEARIENVREFVSVARKYDALPAREAALRLLEEAALLSAEDELEAGADRVRLMTLHASKGLEFDAVFLAGLEEGLLPHAKAVAAGRSELEEERRLAYVGMTRARKRLYLTWAIARTLFGVEQVNMPSRFLRELPPEVLEKMEADGGGLLVVEEY